MTVDVIGQRYDPEKNQLPYGGAVDINGNDEAAEICWNLVEECQDRMQPTDRTHLGYFLAYGMDFLITTDKILRHYQVPEGFCLKIISLREARETIGL